MLNNIYNLLPIFCIWMCIFNLPQASYTQFADQIVKHVVLKEEASVTTGTRQVSESLMYIYDWYNQFLRKYCVYFSSIFASLKMQSKVETTCIIRGSLVFINKTISK